MDCTTQRDGAGERVGQSAPRADIFSMIDKCTLLSGKWYIIGTARAVAAEKITQARYIPKVGRPCRSLATGATKTGAMGPEAANALTYHVNNISGYVSAKFWPIKRMNEKVGTYIVSTSSGK